MCTSDTESIEGKHVTEFGKNDKQYVSGVTQSGLVLYKIRDVELDVNLDNEKIYNFQ